MNGILQTFAESTSNKDAIKETVHKLTGVDYLTFIVLIALLICLTLAIRYHLKFKKAPIETGITHREIKNAIKSQDASFLSSAKDKILSLAKEKSYKKFYIASGVLLAILIILMVVNTYITKTVLTA